QDDRAKGGVVDAEFGSLLHVHLVPSPLYSEESVRVRGRLSSAFREVLPLTPALSPEYRGEGGEGWSLSACSPERPRPRRRTPAASCPAPRCCRRRRGRGRGPPPAGTSRRGRSPAPARRPARRSGSFRV